MPLPKANLDKLLEQLRSLPTGDRTAVLAKLNPAERVEVRAKLRGAPPRSASAGAASLRPASPWSQDIADLVANSGGLTSMGKEALARAALAHTPTKTEPPKSMIEMLVTRLWQRAQ